MPRPPAPAVRSAAYEGAAARIEHILGPREHPDVQAVLDVLADALDGQRRHIARQLRSEAAAYQRGVMPGAGQELTYDGGLRRAAKVAGT